MKQGRPFIDETGNVYGKLTVLKFTRFNYRNHACFLCRCECGNEIEVQGYCLRRGDNIACGCQAGYRTTKGKNHHRFVDKTGMKFCKLLVLKLNGFTNGKSTWLCKCDCGKEVIVHIGSLRKNGTKSCGCLKKLEKGEASFNSVFNHYKTQAKRRKLDWNIDKETFRILINSNCFYCGEPPSNVQKARKANGSFIYNGLDRVNSSKGYALDNVVPCCAMCNRMKLDYSTKDFKSQIEKIYKYWASI